MTQSDWPPLCDIQKPRPAPLVEQVAVAELRDQQRLEADSSRAPAGKAPPGCSRRLPPHNNRTVDYICPPDWCHATVDLASASSTGVESGPPVKLPLEPTHTNLGHRLIACHGWANDDWPHREET